MTFDFSPDWMSSFRASAASTPDREPKARLPLPRYPDHAQTADLVSELFAEGTLSPEQLMSLAGLPELKPHLPQALSRLPSSRGKKETPP